MKLTAQQSGIVVCALATAVIHLAAAFDQKLFPGHVDPLFLLNGLGYLGLLGAYFLPIPLVQARHKLAWWALFEDLNRSNAPMVLRLCEELLARNATLEEFFTAFGNSDSDNVQANLHFLDYWRIKQADANS